MEAERAKLQSKLAAKEQVIAYQDALAKHANWQRARRGTFGRRTIKSRLNGVVVKRNKHEGEWVQPGETVMRIIQMDRLRVEGDIDGNKYSRQEVYESSRENHGVTSLGVALKCVESKIVYASPMVELNEFTVRAESRKSQDHNRRWRTRLVIDARIEGKDRFAVVRNRPAATGRCGKVPLRTTSPPLTTSKKTMVSLADSLISSASRPLKLRVRPDLKVRRHKYQGRPFWVVKEPVGLKYYRFQEEEFAILQMLDGETSYDELKQQFESEFPPQRITLQDLQHFHWDAAQEWTSHLRRTRTRPATATSVPKRIPVAS